MSDSSTVSSTPTTEPSGDRFYRTIWRWYFYTGLFVIPYLEGCTNSDTLSQSVLVGSSHQR